MSDITQTMAAPMQNHTIHGNNNKSTTMFFGYSDVVRLERFRDGNQLSTEDFRVLSFLECSMITENMDVHYISSL